MVISNLWHVLVTTSSYIHIQYRLQLEIQSDMNAAGVNRCRPTTTEDPILRRAPVSD